MELSTWIYCCLVLCVCFRIRTIRELLAHSSVPTDGRLRRFPLQVVWVAAMLLKKGFLESRESLLQVTLDGIQLVHGELAEGYFGHHPARGTPQRRSRTRAAALVGRGQQRGEGAALDPAPLRGRLASVTGTVTEHPRLFTHTAYHPKVTDTSGQYICTPKHSALSSPSRTLKLPRRRLHVAPGVSSHRRAGSGLGSRAKIELFLGHIIIGGTTTACGQAFPRQTQTTPTVQVSSSRS